jgi:hypothetical protein
MRAFALVLVLVSFQAVAERSRVLVVAVAADDSDRGRALKLTSELIPQLRVAEERLDVMALEDVVDGPGTVKRGAAYAQGLKLFRSAEEARRGAKFDEAAGLYLQAKEALDGADWRVSFDTWLAALGWSGALGAKADSLRLLFTIKPDFSFESVTPSVSELIERERQGKAEAAQVRFEVTSEVPTVVWLDGRLLGPTPLTAQTRAGRHRLVAMSPGRLAWQREESIGSGTRIDVLGDDTSDGPTLRATLAALAGGFRTGEYLAPVKRFLTAANVPEVLVVGLVQSDGGLETRLVRMSAAGVSSTSTRRGPKDADLVSLVVPQVRALYDRPLGVVLTERGEVSVGPSRRTWSVVSLAAGGALSAAGIVLLAVAGSQFSAAQMIPQTSTVLFDQAVARAQGTLGAGVTTLVLGAAGLGVGTWLFVTSSAPEALPENEPRPTDDPLH